MTLLDKIRQQLKQVSHNEILTDMGYYNLKRGEQTLRHLIATENTYLWLKNGAFDLKYTSNEFLIKLCNILDISDYEIEIEHSLERMNAIRAMKQPYIFIDTQFVRLSQPIFVLAIMETARRIYIDKELLVYKRDSEIFSIISKLVQEHYVKNCGALQIWGNINAYVYHHIDGSKYVFKPDGTRKNDLHITETRAELRVGNKKIF